MNESYHTKPRKAPTNTGAPPTLSDEHRQVLQAGSAISPEVIAESGARTVSTGRELPDTFSERQKRRAPGILFKVHRPNGEVAWSFRPDKPRSEKPGHKYEAPCKALGGAGNVLDILPSQRHLTTDPSVPVIFTEGSKKALSLVSAAREAGVEVLVVAIVGVWNWLSDGEPIPDLAALALEGRQATVMFDSDMLRKVEVQDAAHRLADYLEHERGAEAFVTYFEDTLDGSKVGADDFFAAGGTFKELRMLTRRYDPDDFKRVRLSRDERLRAMLADLQRTYAAMPAAKTGECSDRATMRELIRLAEQGGRVDEEGIVVRAPGRSVAIRTRISQQAQRKSFVRLENSGYLRRIEEPRHKVDKKGAAYLLKASTSARGRALGFHYRERGHEQNVSQEKSVERKPHSNGDMYASENSARAPEKVPELRHSKVVHTWVRRRGRRVVVDSEYVYRLAKPRWEVLAYILEAGGEAHETELLERFGSKSTRLRDFRRRRIAPLMGYRYSRNKATGREQRLELGPPLVELGEDGVVRLVLEWREALEEHRKAGGELEDNAKQERDYRNQSKAYRKARAQSRPADTQPSPLLGKEKVRELFAKRAEEDAERDIEEQRRKVGMTAATFLADELEGVTAVRFEDAYRRWRGRGGEDAAQLRRAVKDGPFHFKPEDDGLYVYREGVDTRGPNQRIFEERRAQDEGSSSLSQASPEPGFAPERKVAPVVGGVYQHGRLCDCWLCEDAELASAYALPAKSVLA